VFPVLHGTARNCCDAARAIHHYRSLSPQVTSTRPRARRLLLSARVGSAAASLAARPARPRRGSPRAGRNCPVMPRPHGSPRHPRRPPAPLALNCVTAAHRRRCSPPPLATAPLRLSAPALLIALADHMFSASCGVKYHGQAHHHLTSALPRSQGIITLPPAAAAAGGPRSAPPRRAPAAPHPPLPLPPFPSPTIPVPTHGRGPAAPPPHNHLHPHNPASLPPLSLNFRSSQAHNQVLLIRALPHRYNLPSPPSPAPHTVRGARAAPQRRAAPRGASPF
jgi:hypothetical protein